MFVSLLNPTHCILTTHLFKSPIVFAVFVTSTYTGKSIYNNMNGMWLATEIPWNGWFLESQHISLTDPCQCCLLSSGESGQKGFCLSSKHMGNDAVYKLKRTATYRSIHGWLPWYIWLERLRIRVRWTFSNQTQWHSWGFKDRWFTSTQTGFSEIKISDMSFVMLPHWN